MKPTYHFLAFTSSLILYSLLRVSGTNAQVIPDTTLPQNSAVTVSESTSRIEGGTRVGGNLFHSFREFSLPTGSEAFFNNSPEIQSIITRVTGGKISSIDGLIRANGTANLFFLNPSGILFGPNAQLNIGGSLIASTASSLSFADGSEFSAINPQAPSLLTVNVPIGLQFGANSGAIRVENTGHNLNLVNPVFPLLIRGNPNGLRVQPGKTLALIGGDVVLEGGILAAGDIALGSVDTGFVSLSPTAIGWTLDYSGVQNFRELGLLRRSLVDASGSINIQGRSLSVRNGSVAVIENTGILPPGEIRVRTSEFVELSGSTPNGLIASSLISAAIAGKGGDITVTTGRLTLSEGAIITARTFSPATGGNVTVNASEVVEVLRSSAINPSAISTINTTTYEAGNSGNVMVSTPWLTAVDGGIVGTTTYSTGKGGDVTVQATDTIELIGVQPRIFAPSSVGAVSFGAGDAGSLTITTSRLIVQDGGRVVSSTFAAGNAGSVTVKASEFAAVSGTVPGSVNPSSIDSSANIADANVRQILGLPDIPSGASGNVTLETGHLSVQEGGLISVRNDGSGSGGLLTVNAGSILVSNTGSITAATASGEGGNISLRAPNLQLRNRGAITATAGGTGNGGNITLEANTLVALENSDITANSVASQGGQVLIQAQGIFGSQFRQELTPQSDITATGGTPGLSGTVEINSATIDPAAGLVELPEDLSDPTTQIVAGCAAEQDNRFVVTGRGGLPADPHQTLRGQAVWQDVRLSNRESSGRENRQVSSHQLPIPDSLPLIEATGWKVDKNGQVQLTANVANGRLQRSWNQPTHCEN